MMDIPRHLQAPPLDTPIGEWWQNHYDHFFVALNPFFRVPGHHPTTSQYGPVYMNRADITDIIDLVENPPDRPFKAPEDFDQTIKLTGEAVRWADVQTQLGISDFKAFAKTVWLWAVAANERPDFDRSIAFKLDVLQSEQGLYKPEEDGMPAILEPVLFDYFSALNVPAVTAWNEWRDVNQSCPVSQFAPDQPGTRIPSERICAIATEGLLLGWGHDDIVGLLAMTDKMRDLANPEDHFEGFWLSADSYADVFNPVEMFDRKPKRLQN